MATETLIERIRRAASPCLGAQIDAAGLSRTELRADDLGRLPFLERRSLDLDVLDDPVGYVRLRDAPSPVRLGTVEGDGVTVVLTWTARDLVRIAWQGAGMLRLAGVGPGARVANTLEGGFATPGSLLLGDALEALGALDVPLGPARDERSAGIARDLIERVGAGILVTDAGTGGALLDSLRSAPSAVPRRIIWCGEEAPSVGPVVDVRRWIAVPEVSTFAAVECDRGTLHLAPGVSAETVGERLILSATEGDAPLLRFDTGLRLEADTTACSCGARGTILRRGSPV